MRLTPCRKHLGYDSVRSASSPGPHVERVNKSVILAAAIVLLVAAAVGGGILIGRATRRTTRGATTPAAAALSVMFSADSQYEGRVLLIKSSCNGDGRLTGSFRWTIAPGTESQSYRIVAGPGDNTDLLASRETTGGQTRIGSLVPGRQYTFTVFKPGFTDVWASSTVTAPSCDDYAAACPAGADLLAQGPVAGATTDTTARVWLRTCYGTSVTIEYMPAGPATWSGAQRTAAADVDPAHDNTLVTTIDGLTPSTKYAYRVVVDGIVPDQPDAHFWTMPAPGAAAKFRFLTASDAHQISAQGRIPPADTFRNMALSNAQFALLIGDQISVDDFATFNPTAKEAYLRHYRDNWSNVPFRSLLASVSTVMMWDDHDIINDWDAKAAAPYPLAKAAFEDFVARQNPPPVRPNGTYFTFNAGEVSFFVLDARSFRDKKEAPDTASKSMLGVEQKAELKQWLKTSTAKFKFITSGVEFHDHQTVPLKTNDAWEGFTTERKEIFDFIHTNRVGGVVLISGDSHWPGVFKHEYGIPEFQTSPAGVTPPNPPASAIGAPDVLFEDGMKNVFGRFDVDTTVAPARVDFTMVQGNGTELYKMSLTDQDLAQ